MAEIGDKVAGGGASGADPTLDPFLENVKTQQTAAKSAFDAAQTSPDDTVVGLTNLQAQLKLTEAINFATNMMMTIHQQMMAILGKLDRAGQ